MRSRGIFVAVIVCVAALCSSALAQQPRQRAYTSLERVGETAARLGTVFCNVEHPRTFQGAIDGINAMPELGDETPLVMAEPGMEDFATVYGNALESAENADAIERAALNGMIHAYDPTGEWRSSEDMPRRPLPGGIMVTLEADGPTPRITEVGAGGPAAQAGILPGDHLLQIDGYSIANLSLALIVTRIQGEINSNIAVTVDRGGEHLEYTMQRVLNVRRPTSWRVEGRIGIIRIETFSENGANAVRDAIREIRQEARNPSGYIIDLRNNSGGLLDQVIETADYFLDGGVVTTIRPFSDCHAEEAETYNARRRDETQGAPVVVLIDHNTASGAELVAAALRERRNAALVGQQSFGHARVHTVIPVNGGRDGFLKLTTGVLTSPGGATWDQTGLTPDIVTEPRASDTDPAMDRAIALLAAAH